MLNGYTKISGISAATKVGVKFHLFLTVDKHLMSSLCLFSLLTVLPAKSYSDVVFTIVK